MKKLLIVFICISLFCLSACGEGQNESDESSKTTNYESCSGNWSEDGVSEEPEETSVTQDETVGQEPSSEGNSEAESVELTDDEMLERFYEQFYGGDLSSGKIDEVLTVRGENYPDSCYYDEITYYWENIRGVTDIANLLDPLYFTDMKYYTAEDFANDTPVAIHLAKNEIYAKHGYIFKSEDLNNYFLGCAWYTPLYTAEEFDDSVFNDYERKNLELLAELDAANASALEEIGNSKEEVPEDSFYAVDEYGSIETREQHYTNSQGQEGYYYMVDCFYVTDKTNSGKYDLVNQTLQQIYAEKEAYYQEYCAESIADFEPDENFSPEQYINYVRWYLVNIPYIGDDYVSILFNDIDYWAGAAHPYSYFEPVTISVETGEIVSAKDVLNMSWEDIWNEINGELQISYEREEAFEEEYGFYLTDHTLTYIYRTSAYVDSIAIMR